MLVLPLVAPWAFWTPFPLLPHAASIETKINVQEGKNARWMSIGEEATMGAFMRSAAILLLVTFASGSAACATFDAPPEVTIDGEKDGLLSDPKAPIVLAFSKPPVPDTLKLEIAQNAPRDSDGNLVMPLTTLFTHDPTTGDTGGTGKLAADGSTMTITLDVPPPAGPQYVLLVEPGLSDVAGTVTRAQRQLVFGYDSTLHCNAPVSVFQPGKYFFLVAVDQPIAVQIQLFGDIDVDPATGATKGVFTKAKRNPDPSRCKPACPSSDACQLVPTQACVTPSTPAASVDEFSDYVPNPSPPTGFSFSTTGCAVDQDGTSAFATAPVDVEVTSPHVTLRNAALSTSFAPDDSGILRGTGTLTADAVLLGTIDSGMGHGNLTARSIPAGQAPPGIPGP